VTVSQRYAPTPRTPFHCRHIAALGAQTVESLLTQPRIPQVKFPILFASALLVTLAAPLAAQAQGVPGGIQHGIYEGGRRAGPVGAVVGGAVGGVIGGVEGVLGTDRVYYAQPEPVYRQRVYRGRSSHRHSRVRHHRYRRASRY
jgi:hypothetical protein